jgi:hypothetical protein
LLYNIFWGFGCHKNYRFPKPHDTIKNKKGERKMKLEMDTIQFESRAEIGEIIRALEEWQDEHKNDRKADTVKKLIDKLDVMSMCW